MFNFDFLSLNNDIVKIPVCPQVAFKLDRTVLTATGGIGFRFRTAKGEVARNRGEVFAVGSGFGT